MPLTLHTIAKSRGEKRPKRRVGRGNASGRGTYSGRGIKGQKARSGGRRGLKQRALKQQLFSKLPKFKSFKSLREKMYVVNLEKLEKAFNDGSLVTPASLIKAGLVSLPKSRGGKIKILGSGVLAKKLYVKAHAFSSGAKSAIEKGGGTTEVML